jgi:hypothetical protein
MRPLQPKETVQLMERINERLEARFRGFTKTRQLSVDLADVYEICAWYISTIDKLLTRKTVDSKAVEKLLVDLDVQLATHMDFHVKSLKRLVPKAADCIAIGSVKQSDSE